MADPLIQFRAEETTRIKAAENGESDALKAMKAASRIAEENGISDLTLDNINAEIAEARK